MTWSSKSYFLLHIMLLKYERFRLHKIHFHSTELNTETWWAPGLNKHLLLSHLCPLKTWFPSLSDWKDLSRPRLCRWNTNSTNGSSLLTETEAQIHSFPPRVLLFQLQVCFFCWPAQSLNSLIDCFKDINHWSCCFRQPIRRVSRKTAWMMTLKTDLRPGYQHHRLYTHIPTVHMSPWWQWKYLLILISSLYTLTPSFYFIFYYHNMMMGEILWYDDLVWPAWRCGTQWNTTRLSFHIWSLWSLSHYHSHPPQPLMETNWFDKQLWWWWWCSVCRFNHPPWPKTQSSPLFQFQSYL